jgi:hypothetical protein
METTGYAVDDDSKERKKERHHRHARALLLLSHISSFSFKIEYRKRRKKND